MSKKVKKKVEKKVNKDESGLDKFEKIVTKVLIKIFAAILISLPFLIFGVRIFAHFQKEKKSRQHYQEIIDKWHRNVESTSQSTIQYPDSCAE